MADSLKSGDIVRLKSGGPGMQITQSTFTLARTESYV